jgi:hypothetical protein
MENDYRDESTNVNNFGYYTEPAKEGMMNEIFVKIRVSTPIAILSCGHIFEPPSIVHQQYDSVGPTKCHAFPKPKLDSYVILIGIILVIEKYL